MTVIRREGESLESYVARLEAANAELAKKASSSVKKIGFKVSDNTGIVMLTGVNANPRMTVNSYANQWYRIAQDAFGLDAATFEATPLGKFIVENREKIKARGGWREAEAAAAQAA